MPSEVEFSRLSEIDCTKLFFESLPGTNFFELISIFAPMGLYHIGIWTKIGISEKLVPGRILKNGFTRPLLKRFNGKLIQSSIGEYWKLIQNKAFCRKLYFTNSGASHRSFYWKTHSDQMLYIIYGFSQKIRIDEFFSKTFCVTPQN